MYSFWFVFFLAEKLLKDTFSLFFHPQLLTISPFLVPLAKKIKDWKLVAKGLLFGCCGIAILAIIATFSGVAHWQFKLPSFAAIRILSNLFLTSIPEEGFYRGFLQNTLCKYFENIKCGRGIALILTSVLFTATHIYWSPNLPILIFIFLASLLYGCIYMVSKKIELSILCHFGLNFIHMILFSYHAM
jgi:membrane protease YdiL (CAAX protease family)